MNEREAMLDAIFAAPADDAPRLIYADWLEEQGESAQAEWIRHQLSHPSDDSMDHPELLHACLQEVGWQSDQLPRYERGLPALLEIEVPDLARWSPGWWPRFPVRRVALRLTPLNVEQFVSIPYLSHLRELVLEGEDPHNLILPFLVRCRALKGLQRLDLYYFSLGIEAATTLARTDIFLHLRELQMPHLMRPNREAGMMLRRRYGDICVF